MKLGFIIPNYPHEKRVALLPQHIDGFDNELVVETGFGKTLGIDDAEYIKTGCTVGNRQDIFESCDAIFSLKLIQPIDYDYLRKGQMIIGWTHPTGSGMRFMEEQAIPKELVIVDIDNVYPRVYYKGKAFNIDWLKRDFIWKNSFYAGYSATLHGLLSFGLLPNSNTKVAILASGNVSQGAFNIMSKLGADIRMYYRKTMEAFKENLHEFDIIINGIEMDIPDAHILTKEELKRVKKNCLIIDAAADAGNAIEGTRYTSIDDPIYEEKGIYYYDVNNAPTLFHRETSDAISESFSKYIYKKDTKIFLNLIRE